MLEVFRAYGAEYIFCSPGSEWPALWDAVARAKAEGKGPRYLNTRHEELTVTAAIGYYRQSGRLPVVALHTTVRTLHASMARRSPRHDRVPMVVLAGDSAGYGLMPGPDPGAQWARVLTDTGGSAGIAQPYVKRTSAVTCCEVLLGMVQDACRLALTPPFGPVFLSMPVEFLQGNCASPGVRCAPPPLPTCAPVAALEQVARDLLQAQRPVLVTELAGREPRNVDLLVELAESLALPVAEARYPMFVNFPRDHVLHQGFEVGELLADADLVLLVGSQMPWYPTSNGPKNARIILVDEDPAHELLHYWGYGVDQVIGGELAFSLRGLVEQVKRLDASSAAGRAAREERLTRCRETHEQLWEGWRAQALATRDQRPMNTRWAFHTLGEVLPTNAIVVIETLFQEGLLLRYLKGEMPGTQHYHNTGGLGVMLGEALGLKLAAPDRLVAAVLGDGALHYNPVMAAFGFAQQFKLPILVVVLDNQGYVSQEFNHRRAYPDGWGVRTDTFVGAQIEPTPDYSAIARAFGGYGERVEDPAALSGALKRAIERVDGGQLALVDIIADPFAHLKT